MSRATDCVRPRAKTEHRPQNMVMKAKKARSSKLATVKGEKGKKALAPAKKAGGSKGLKLGDFFAFQQCQLKMEARYFMNTEFELKDPAALEIWPLVEKLETRNQGKNEKWVPYHTVLGVHELFVVKEIHHAKVSCWTPYSRFVTMCIFRSHCSLNLFQRVQRPYLEQASFWKDPVAGFALKTPLHLDTMKYRKAGNALQTSSFLIIPERLVDDADENLVMNLMIRTQRLIQLADKLWPLVSDKKAPQNSEALFQTISSMISEVCNLGETWVKMLMVCIHLAYPNLSLLQNRCEVGTGAKGGMLQMLEDEGMIEPKGEKEKTGDELIRLVVNLKGGIVELRQCSCRNIQLLQVGSHDRRFPFGLASFDRAHAMVAKLAEFAREGMQIDKLLQKKEELFKDTSLKVPKLGLDAKRAKELAAAAALGQKTDVEKTQDKKAVIALSKLCEIVNKSDSPSCEHFWNLNAEVEAQGKKTFAKWPLIVEQMKTKRRCLSAATLQVQLCEWRQFQNYPQQFKCKDTGSAAGKVTKKIVAAASPAKRRRTAKSASDVKVVIKGHKPLTAAASPAKRGRIAACKYD